MAEARQWYYRGSLKSCNYSCSYCPFCKSRSTTGELARDKEQLFRFITELENDVNLHGAVQIVPYGEALIHSYYWEGLARLSRNPGIEAVGAQSNFSFPVKQMVNHYIQSGGDIRKLRLWGTFHPEMTTVESFLQQCKRLSQQHITYCVGTVGVPIQIPDIRKLREELPAEIYLWVNKMDGLHRNYTSEEITQFLQIDPYFESELHHYRADKEICGNQIFVEADGSMRRCNICRSEGNLYDSVRKQPVCNRKECSCYLAYNNRKDFARLFFYPYPAFRIPTYPKAVFLDVDGTLVPKGESRLPQETIQQLKRLAEHSAVYLATSLAYEDAMRKVNGIRSLLAGGVYACGGRCMIKKYREEGTCWETVADMECSWIENLETIRKKYGFRIHIYQKENQVYKVTLHFPRRKTDRSGSVVEYLQKVVSEIDLPKNCRWFMEDSCIEIIRSDRGKLEGVLEIMQEMGYGKEEVFVAGDSSEDEQMLEYFPFSVQVDGDKILKPF